MRAPRRPRKTVPTKSANQPDISAMPSENDITGRFIVTFAEGVTRADAQKAVHALTGQSMEVSAEKGFELEAALAGDDSIIFDELNLASMHMSPTEMSSLSSAVGSDQRILAIEPDRVVYALGTIPTKVTDNAAREYIRGYRDGINALVAQLLGEAEEQVRESGVAASWDQSVLTWGLQATKAHESRFTGRGIKVAILDTGIEFQHPDFIGRQIESKSFISGELVQDGNGHGTHCAGTSCGVRTPARQPRYGIASDASLFVGKVLSNSGRGSTTAVLAGMDWAIRQKCEIVSMSLGSPVGPGDSPSIAYENAGERALRAGSLIIAAAGNESHRPSDVAPVGSPANCQTIMAVAALDENFGVANFSNGAINGGGGGVDIAAPGVNVNSSWLMPRQYRSISGTSMACPHVAGIAALYAQADNSLRGRALWAKLTASARRLTSSARDVGAGLVIAP